jgi:hypothetical protein
MEVSESVAQTVYWVFVWRLQVEANTRNDIEEKKHALRKLVGDSYRHAWPTSIGV